MPTLQEVYDNPKTTSRNPTTLAKRAGTTVAGAKRFLNSLSSTQLGKRVVKQPAEAFAPTGGPRGTYLADTIHLSAYSGVNQKRTSVLCLVESTSRYVYARGLLRIASKNTAEALEEILEQNHADVLAGRAAPLVAIRCDGGPELRGEFAALCEERVIPIEVTSAGTHERLSRLDRWVGTFRRMLGDLFDLTGGHVWFPHLQELVDNYNERPSRALIAAGPQTAPADVGPQQDAALRRADMSRAAAVRTRTDR
ncbi:MAG: hypothetical protein ACK528_05825, partial [Alphaproteobacteria bacterium]